MKGILAAALLALGLAPGILAQEEQARRVVEGFARTYTAMNDYQCRVRERCTKDGAVEERIIDFYFKRPRRIRMDIRLGNRLFDTGSVGIYQGGDKVTGRKGGILSFLAITVDKSDAQATTIRGVRFDQSDLQATLERLQGYFASGRVSAGVLGNDQYELALFPDDPKNNEGIEKEIIRFDPHTFLPAVVYSYEGGRCVQHIEWQHFIINAGLPDELFEIRYDAAKLAEGGKPSIHGLPVE